MVGSPLIGILSLQGGVEEHATILESLGATVRRVRLPGDLEGLDGIVLPGGESSTIDKLARTLGLAEPLYQAILPVQSEKDKGERSQTRTERPEGKGLPVLATCAGLIYSAKEIENPAPGQQTLGILDATVRRNAFGNQRFSTERTVPIDLPGDVSAAVEVPFTVEASFIRAPIVTRVGEGVDVIARVAGGGLGDVDGEDTFTVGVRQDNVWALSFHPEENGDERVHAAWLQECS